MARPPNFRMIFVVSMLAGLFCACAYYPAKKNETGQEPTKRTRQQNAALEFFGNISNAGEDPNNFLIVGDGSAFSYNSSRGTVNWIAWRTTRADLGDSVERPDFGPDLRLPAGIRRVTSGDYSGSGYDRGHLVPAADRFGSPAIFGETFLMTNIVPQTSSLNQYSWQQFESYARSQVRRGWDAYQIAGVYGEQDALKKRVVVPTNCWKIIVFMRAGQTPERVDSRTRIIAVDMPNNAGMERDSWQRYVTNIRSIESKTGYNFFASIAADLQEILETRQELNVREPSQ